MMRRGTVKISVIAILTALVILMSACTQAPLRLHIMANSNSMADQDIKLRVRDAVLDLTGVKMSACENLPQARVYIESNLETIMMTANKVLGQGGFTYSAKAKLGTFHFPEKKYQGITYPEGEYEALRITLGNGEGDNWWCVMFPPLCLTETEFPVDEETKITSFFAEFIQSLFG